MDTIFEYASWDVVDLKCIDFPGYLLSRDGRIWSTIRNRWKNLDVKGCTLLVNARTPRGVRLSVKVLVGQLFVVPELLSSGFMYLPIDNRYLINDVGSVYSTTHATFLTWNIVKQYAYVSIGEHSELVHRLVALTFIPNPYGYNEVNHIDGNKLNNSRWNLEWCNRSMNMKHAYQMGFLNESLAKAQQARFTK